MIQTDFPMYLMHSYELPHRGDGLLFHFTKAESFFKIMEDMTLLPSSFEKLNDLNEGNIHNMGMNRNFMVMYNAEKCIKEKCHIISFSQNYEINGYCIEGTNHPAMWGHYADNSNGVCIVINKDKPKRNTNIFIIINQFPHFLLNYMQILVPIYLHLKLLLL